MAERRFKFEIVIMSRSRLAFVSKVVCDSLIQNLFVSYYPNTYTVNLSFRVLKKKKKKKKKTQFKNQKNNE